MGADIQIENGYIRARAERLTGARLVLETVTVTGTENLLMAATLAEGETIIENAAREPEVVDLADFLNAMGAQIAGAGTDRIVVAGREQACTARATTCCPTASRPARISSPAPSRADACARKGRGPDHLDAVISKLREAGADRDASARTGSTWTCVAAAPARRRHPHRALPRVSRRTCKRSSPRSTRSRTGPAPSPKRSSRTASCTCSRCVVSARTSASRAIRRSCAACRSLRRRRSWRRICALPRAWCWRDWSPKGATEITAHLSHRSRLRVHRRETRAAWRADQAHGR